MKHGVDQRDLSEFFPTPCPRAREPQPPEWPDENQKRRMIDGYGRVLTWDEFSYRASRFMTDGSELS